jgi:hypothetical protein
MNVALLASELGRTLRLKSSIFKQDFCGTRDSLRNRKNSQNCYKFPAADTADIAVTADNAGIETPRSPGTPVAQEELRCRR